MSVFVVEFGAVAVSAPSEKSWMMSSISEKEVVKLAASYKSRLQNRPDHCLVAAGCRLYPSSTEGHLCPTLHGDLKRLFQRTDVFHGQGGAQRGLAGPADFGLRPDRPSGGSV